MNKLKLILPTPEYKTQIMDYKKEFIENGEGMEDWSRYIELLKKIDCDCYMMFEFVNGDDHKQLIENAATLGRLIDDVKKY